MYCFGTVFHMARTSSLQRLVTATVTTPEILGGAVMEKVGGGGGAESEGMLVWKDWMCIGKGRVDKDSTVVVGGGGGGADLYRKNDVL